MTRMTRRGFAKGMAGSAAALVLPHGVSAQSPAVLRAAPARVQLAPSNYPQTEVWGFGGSVPGPMIRVQQGARMVRRFENALPQDSTVHWHGIRLENGMDGVPGMTQSVVAPGDSFEYDFAVPDAGTYWYHPHNRSYEQMARGLYGPLIVDETDGAPEVDVDEVLILDDWRLTEDAQIAEGFGNLHDWSHGGRIGNWITVNGSGAWSRAVQQGQRLRLRLINTANARIFTAQVQGFDGWVVALDGMPLAQPQRLDQITLAPAQRVDLIVDVVAQAGEEALLVSLERDGGYAVAAFPVAGVARQAPLGIPAPLPPNPVPALGPLGSARRVDLLMEGGAMGRMRGAMIGGEMRDMRAMARAGKVWAFNGMAEMPDTPLVEAARGETLRIAITNDSSWPHAMHLHGHHFRQVFEDGTIGPLRDTLLMNRGELAEIAFVADNPGDWLLHCHMLEHSAAGMMTWLRVT